jgi:hypothetical protein
MCFRVGFNEIFLISLKVLDPVSFSQLAHMFSPLMGDKNINSGISQKVFVDFLKNVSRIYQLCCFAYFTRSRRLQNCSSITSRPFSVFSHVKLTGK